MFSADRFDWMEYRDDVSCRWLKLVVNNGDSIGVLCTGFLQPPANLANLTTTERVTLALQQGVLVCIKDPFVNNAYTDAKRVGILGLYSATITCLRTLSERMHSFLTGLSTVSLSSQVSF